MIRESRKQDRREKILKYISGYINTHGYAPSYREIAAAVHCSLYCVSVYMNRLFEERCLETDLPYRNSPRGFRLAEKCKGLTNDK